MFSIGVVMYVLVTAGSVLGTCSAPSYGKNNPQCNTGDFNGCVPAKSVEFSSLCNGDPALESACLQQASLRANKECGAYCMDVVDCVTCLNSIQLLGLSAETCTTGDMNYCGC